MKYYLDTEFNSFNGELLSLALVDQNGRSLYLRYPEPAIIDPWVLKNVMPVMDSVPSYITTRHVTPENGPHLIAQFLYGGIEARIVADWPDDISYFCKALITGPGQMAAVDNLEFKIVRIDAYPTIVPGAIQHNAWWDAMALRTALVNRPGL